MEPTLTRDLNKYEELLTDYGKDFCASPSYLWKYTPANAIPVDGSNPW